LPWEIMEPAHFFCGWIGKNDSCPENFGRSCARNPPVCGTKLKSELYKLARTSGRTLAWIILCGQNVGKLWGKFLAAFIFFVNICVLYAPYNLPDMDGQKLPRCFSPTCLFSNPVVKPSLVCIFLKNFIDAHPIPMASLVQIGMETGHGAPQTTQRPNKTLAGSYSAPSLCNQTKIGARSRAAHPLRWRAAVRLSRQGGRAAVDSSGSKIQARRFYIYRRGKSLRRIQRQQPGTNTVSSAGSEAKSQQRSDTKGSVSYPALFSSCLEAGDLELAERWHARAVIVLWRHAAAAILNATSMQGDPTRSTTRSTPSHRGFDGSVRCCTSCSTVSPCPTSVDGKRPFWCCQPSCRKEN